jgi:hypothetical protein
MGDRGSISGKRREGILFLSSQVTGLDGRGSRIRFSAGAGNFSLHHRVQNDSATHPASYPVGTRVSFPGGKTAGA